MKNFGSLVITVSLWITVFGEGQYYPLLKDGIKASVQQIKSDHELSERSAENPGDVFKKIMAFTVVLDNGNSIELVMERNDRQTPHVLVKVTSDSGSEMMNMDNPKDYRFYQVLGQDHGGAVMVRCPDFKEPCFIAGNFYYQGNEYIIDPDTGVADLAANDPYTVYRLKPTGIKYGDDAIPIRVDSRGSDEPDKKSQNQQFLSKLMALLAKSERSKRQTTPVQRSFKIELEMVVCDDVFTFWMARLGQNRDAAIQKIAEYYEQIANNMDIRFSTVTSSTMEVDIIPYLINIRETPLQCSWVTSSIVGNNTDGIEAYNAGSALDKFEIWAKSNKNPNSDAIMSFSRRDMWIGGVIGGNSTAGLARSISDSAGTLSTTCRTDFIAASIVEDLMNGDTSATASHELAHNLGVEHDFNTTNCLASQQFIMAPYSWFVGNVADAKNPWTFSPCSIATMARTLPKLPKDSNGLTCLERNNFNTADYNRVLTSDLLGKIYSKDDQCALDVGPGSVYCSASWTNVALADICWKGLPCSLSVINGFCNRATYINAAIGTNCGGTKVCYQGLCIESANIPPADTEPVVAVSSTTTTSTTTTTKPTTTTTPSTTTTTKTTPTTTTPSTTTTTKTTPTTTTTTSSTATTTKTTPTTTTTTTTKTTPTTMTTKPSTTTTTKTTPTTTITTPSTTTTTKTTPTTTTTTTTKTTPTTTTTTPSTTTTTKTTPTTATTRPSTTSATQTTTSTPQTTTTTTQKPFTDDEMSFLLDVSNRCDISCSCWRRQCKRFRRDVLCRLFAPECY